MLLLAVIVALLVLANLSAEQSLPEDDWMAFGHKSYGWPLIWHRYVLCYPSHYMEGWYLSPGRLAANVATWLVIIVVPTAICEWLLSRYRLRMRWSLRTMLAAIGLIALGFAWFVQARNRANDEDALIAAIHDRGEVWMEHWGPKWLDLFGADRYRRRIVGVWKAGLGIQPADREILQRIGRLRGLQHLNLSFHQWTPELGLADTLQSLPRLRSLAIYGAPAREWRAAVGKMSRLERLSVAYDADLCACLERLPKLKSLSVWKCFDAQDSHALLTAVGKLKKLEELSLDGMIVRSFSFTCLSGLTELRLLSLSSVHTSSSSLGNCDANGEGKPLRDLLPLLRRPNYVVAVVPDDGGLLQSLPPLPRVEAVVLHLSDVRDDDVGPLANLPRLRSLSLAGTSVTDVGLAQLAPAASLEELAIGAGMVSPSGLWTLSAVKRLRILHLDLARSPFDEYPPMSRLALDNGMSILVLASELPEFRRALEALRRSKPGIQIDNLELRPFESRFSADFEGRGPGALPDRHSTWWPACEWPALSPSERAVFQKRGGWARFDAAGWEPNGPTTKF